MTDTPTLDELWASAPPADQTFDPDQVAELPNPARHYLEHAIAPGTPLATTVALLMHGEIKLQSWVPFSARQVIRWDRGMIWRATARMFGVVPIRGFDRLIDGQGEQRWNLLGLIPVVAASGPDITRSTAGRMAAEFVWLPSALCRDSVVWTAPDISHAHASFRLMGEDVNLKLAVDGVGGVESVKFQRWGAPGDSVPHYADFGGSAEDERTFGGYTIPIHLRIGWYFGTDRFGSEGEFFRVTIDDAQFR